MTTNMSSAKLFNRMPLLWNSEHPDYKDKTQKKKRPRHGNNTIGTETIQRLASAVPKTYVRHHIPLIIYRAYDVNRSIPYTIYRIQYTVYRIPLCNCSLKDVFAAWLSHNTQDCFL